MRQLTGGLFLSVEPNHGQLSFVRREIRLFLQQRGIDDDAWALVADELVANAIDAITKAGPGTGADEPTVPVPVRAPARITVTVTVHQVRVQMTVAGVGPAYRLPAPGLAPQVTARRGRGLHLVRCLVDAVEVQRIDGVNVTTCWRTIPSGSG